MSVLTRETFRAGSTIFREGEEGDSGYIVVEGAVELSHVVLNRRAVAEVVRKDGLFGIMVLLEKASNKRMMTAVALEDTTCLVVDRERFQSHLQKGDPFVRGVIAVLSDRLRAVTAQLTSGGVIDRR